MVFVVVLNPYCSCYHYYSIIEFGDSRRFLRQSPFSAMNAEIGDYSRQRGQAF